MLNTYHVGVAVVLRRGSQEQPEKKAKLKRQKVDKSGAYVAISAVTSPLAALRSRMRLDVEGNNQIVICLYLISLFRLNFISISPTQFI